MDKKEMLRIQSLTKKLMRLDNQIWNKHGWEHGDMVKDEIHRKEVKEGLAKLGITKINGVVSHNLEDANFHTLNTTLEELGLFSPSYEATEKEYDRYIELGGKTWEL